MQEHHPIDELFREALQGLVKAPPSHVRGAVLGAVRSRRKRVLWRKRSFLAILLLIVGTGGLWIIQDSINNRNVIPSAETHGGPASLAGASLSTPQTAEAGRAEATIALGAVDHARTGGADAKPRLELTVEANGAQSDHGYTSAGGSASSRNHMVLVMEPAPSSTTSVLSEGIQYITVRDQHSALPGSGGDASRMLLLGTTPFSSPLNGIPAIAPALSLPSLSQGDSWLAVHASANNTSHHWSGTSTRLVDAINDAERSRITTSLGVMVGRQWRSGFGIATGAEAEHYEQVFRHEETLVHEQESVIANLVTLNTIVYSMSYDTLTTRYSEPVSAEGRDVRTAVRVPLEAYWQGFVRRWVIGMRAGLAAEFTRVRSNASLVQEAGDGSIRSRSLSANELASRYPACVLGTVGADVGFVLGERTTLLATPQYQRALDDGPRNALSATPERFGIRFQLLRLL